MTLYKFRSPNFLLDEINNQYIYLSKLEGLNDPMEGINKVCWKGDKKLWENLFNHFFFCLYDIMGDSCLSKLNKNLRIFDLEKYLNLKRPEVRNLLPEINRLFIEDSQMINCLELLSELTIYKNDLTVILTAIGYYAICVIKQINKHDYISYNSTILSPQKDMEYINDVRPLYYGIKELNSEGYLKQLIKTLEEKKQYPNDPSLVLLSEFSLLLTKNLPYHLQIRHTPLKLVTEYIVMMETRLNDKIYISSFSEDYKSATMWAHYASSHKGVCLIFDKKLLTESLPQNFSYHKVGYSKRYQEINFFEASNFSLQNIRGENFDTTINAPYQQEYYSNLTTKLSDWSYEEEHRIISDKRQNFNNSSDSWDKLYYGDHALTGIIFGIDTAPDVKQQALNAILSKKALLNDKKDSSTFNFKIYQAYYSEDSHGIAIFDCMHILEDVLKLIARTIG